MATFTVVMRSLTKGQARNIKRCVLQSQNYQLHITDVISRGLGSQLLVNSSSHRSIFSFKCSSFSSSLQPASTKSCSNYKRIQYPVTAVPYQHSLAFSLHRTMSTSPSDQQIKQPQSQQEKTTASDSSESESKDETKEPQKESWWRGKNSWRLGLVFLSGTFIAWGVGLINIWGAPELDPDGNEITDEFTEMPAALAYVRRTWKEMNIFKKKIQDPSRELLLPDPLKYPYMQPPYTLVLELTGVLIHPDWTYNTGWRFKKRPGIDYFLQQVGPPLFEVVIYSQEAGMTADPLVNHVDPQGYIMYRLYRDATRYMDGKHVKDLSCLNREMSRVIMLDCNQDAVSLQPRNSLVLDKWMGQDEDRKLIDLAHFLKTIGTSGVEDIRPVLDYYNQFDDPLEAFKDNQRKLQDEEAARQQKVQEESSKKRGWLSGLSLKR